MADAAAARREARRKRILENSHNRLQLISGKCSDESLRESTNRSPNPQIFEDFTNDIIPSDNDISSKFTFANGGIEFDSQPFELLSSRHDVVDGEVANDLAAFESTASEQAPTPLPPWKTVLNYKYDIVILSLLLQLLHGLFEIPFGDTYFFLPLIVYSVTKTFVFPNNANSSIANALLLFNGMTPNRLHTLLQIMLWTATLSQEVFIFIFTTVCSQSLFTLVKETYNT